MCTQHHQAQPRASQGVQEPVLESVPAPCLVRTPKAPTRPTANSFLMLLNSHSCPQTSTGPPHQRGSQGPRMPAKAGGVWNALPRHLFWSIAQGVVREHHPVFQVFPDSEEQHRKTRSALLHGREREGVCEGKDCYLAIKVRVDHPFPGPPGKGKFTEH